jgi:hypothetical protein
LRNITVEAQYPNASIGDDIAFNTDTGMVYHLVNNNSGSGIVYQFNGTFLSLFVSLSLSFFIFFYFSPSWLIIILGQLACHGGKFDKPCRLFQHYYFQREGNVRE